MATHRGISCESQVQFLRLKTSNRPKLNWLNIKLSKKGDNFCREVGRENGEKTVEKRGVFEGVLWILYFKLQSGESMNLSPLKTGNATDK